MAWCQTEAISVVEVDIGRVTADIWGHKSTILKRFMGCFRHRSPILATLYHQRVGPCRSQSIIFPPSHRHAYFSVQKTRPFEEVDVTSLQYQASICISFGNDHVRLFSQRQRYVHNKDMWRLGSLLAIILVVACWLEERLMGYACVGFAKRPSESEPGWRRVDRTPLDNFRGFRRAQNQHVIDTMMSSRFS